MLLSQSLFAQRPRRGTHYVCTFRDTKATPLTAVAHLLLRGADKQLTRQKKSCNFQVDDMPGSLMLINRAFYANKMAHNVSNKPCQILTLTCS